MTGKFSRTDLNELQRQVEGWRRRQLGRPRLPVAIWKAAAAVARFEGVSQVSRTLGLDYYKLSQWAAPPKASRASASQKAKFVELTLSGSRGDDGYRAEVGDGSADKLTLHLGRDLRAVVALAQAFWGRAG